MVPRWHDGADPCDSLVAVRRSTSDRAPGAVHLVRHLPRDPGRMRKPFAEQDHWSVTVGAGLAFGAREAELYYNGFVSIETFIVRDFQLAVELGGWYFDQDNDDAIGATVNFDLRWHFLHDDERDRWSIFGAAGIGVLGATDDVPEDSSEFGFTPRIGAGFTWRFGDGEERLVAGLRWQHISNARLQGTRDNYGSDSAMVFVGVSIPF